MIENRAVLVLGAGASKPYGLPLGSELRDEVLRASTDLDLRARLGGNYDSQLQDFCASLAQSGFSSVDAFLEQRPEWTDIGKSAMALCLLAAERQAKDKLFPPHQPKDHWYEVLWSCLRAPSWSAFKRQPLTVVTFNYDRSLEHYLARVLTNNYSIKPETARAALPVLHVHGTLGEYDGTFGQLVDKASYNLASRSIRVVHEADVRHSDFVRARTLIVAAERVLCVGFGYHDANMRKLGFGTTRRLRTDPPKILGTHKGIKAHAWQRLCNTYYFSPVAAKQGAGSISEFVAEWLV